MTRLTTALFGGYTVLSVAGLLLLRANAAPALSLLRDGSGQWRSLVLAALGATAYILGFGLWVLILARVPLVQAYPTAVGLTLVFTTLTAVLVLHEPLAPRAVVGSLAVFLGVWLLAGA